MRIYTASSQEILRARKLLKDWADEAFLSDEQYRRMEQETASDLRTTNVFLRLVLFLFTLIIVGAAVALFFNIFFAGRWDQTSGVVLLAFSGLCYLAAELAVSRARLSRYGIEEALVVCSVGLFCVGLAAALFGGNNYSVKLQEEEALVPAAGAVLSLWIWHRFGLWYAFLAAMVFSAFVPTFWFMPPSAHRLVVTGCYAAGLAGVLTLRSRDRSDYLNDDYSLAEAFLWAGVYLTINLQLPSLNPVVLVGYGSAPDASEFPRSFYWITWVLIWCLPPVILGSGLFRKDRWVIAAGIITAILTLVTNKPYLGWPRHTWDPMLLGAFLASVAVLLRRWLARDPTGIRHGFTADRLSAKHKAWIDSGSAVMGLVSPAVVPAPRAADPPVRFGGGDSGGAGATSEF